MCSISYVLTIDDYRALWRNDLKRRAGFAYGIIKRLPLIGILFGVAMILSKWFDSDLIPRNNKGWIDYGVILMVLGSTRYIPATLHFSLRKIQKNAGFGTHSHLDLVPEGVRWNGVHGEGLIFWTHIMRVEEESDHFFVYISERQAFIIPKREFGTPSETQKFGAFAQTQWRQAHNVEAVPPIAAPK